MMIMPYTNCVVKIQSAHRKTNTTVLLAQILTRFYMWNKRSLQSTVRKSTD